MADVLAAIAGLGSAGGGILSGLSSLIFGGEQMDLEWQNLEWQQQAWHDNYQMQLENQQYERDLQKWMWEREDTSVQRRVADLEAAGLSPVLAAGQGAQAGPVVRSDAPQRQAAQRGVGGLAMKMQAMQVFANVAKTAAEAAYIGEETRGKSLENEFSQRSFLLRLESISNQNALTSSQQIRMSYLANEAAISSDWKQKAADFIRERYPGVANRSPDVLEYMILEKAFELQQHDTDILTRIPLPSGTLGALSNLLGRFIR